jgi:hypothetical protein
MNTLHVGHIYYMGWHVLLLKEVKKQWSPGIQSQDETKRSGSGTADELRCIINYSSPQTSRGIYCWV